MTEAELSRAAKAIKRLLHKTNGTAGPWSLAKVALSAARFVSRGAVTCEGERAARSTAKVKSLRERAVKAAAARKRMAALRAETGQEQKDMEAA